jgi:hypothetical protein
MADPFPLDDLDEANPYAPPRSAFVPDASPFQAGYIPFTIGDILDRSWRIFKERLGICVAIVFGVGALNFGTSFALGMMLQVLVAITGSAALMALGNFLVQIAAAVLSVWLTIGQNLALLRVARGQQVDPQDVFRGGPYILRVIGASILFGLLLFIPFVAAGIGVAVSIALFQAKQSAIGVAILLLAVAAAVPLLVYLSARLAMFYYLAIDRDAGVVDSLRWSWEMTRDRALPIIAIYLLTLLINLGGALACLVGLIFTIPLTALIMVVTYLALAGTDKPARKLDEGIWEVEDFA